MLSFNCRYVVLNVLFFISEDFEISMIGIYIYIGKGERIKDTNKNFSVASVLPSHCHCIRRTILSSNWRSPLPSGRHLQEWSTRGIWKERWILNGGLHPADQDIVSDSLIDARKIRTKKCRYWTRFPLSDDRNTADDLFRDFVSEFSPYLLLFRFCSVSTMRFVVIIIIV